jgi:hypothetical protein
LLSKMDIERGRPTSNRRCFCCGRHAVFSSNSRPLAPEIPASSNALTTSHPWRSATA